MASQGTLLLTWLSRRKELSLALISLFWLVAFLVASFGPDWMSRPLSRIDLALQDELAISGRKTPANPDIIFLGIDSASTQLDALDPQVVQANPILSLMAKPWPWSREIYAAALARLCDAGARVVVIDILFTDASPGDPVLHAALDRYSGHVLIGCNWVDEEHLSLPSKSLIPPSLPLDPRVALVNVWPNPMNNVIRSARFEVPYVGAAIGQVDSTEKVESISNRVLSLLGRDDLAIHDFRQHTFRYTGPTGAFKTASIYEIFDPTIWKHNFQNGAVFKDKIVMIGPRGNFHQDQHLTPLGLMDGAEVHLQALNAAWHGEFLLDLAQNPLLLGVLAVAAAATAWVLSCFISSLVHRAGAAAILAVLYVASAAPLYSAGIILPVADPLGIFVATILTGMGAQFVVEQLERARTRRIFERYVSANVVREILENPEPYYAALGGQRRLITVLFSDLRGFTTMSEQLTSEEIIFELNEYLTRMTPTVFEHHGTLDKYIGDAIMAVWGNFRSDPARDAQNAILTALAMIRALVMLNVQRRERGRPDLAMGIGINHGDATVGNIGHELNMNFTVIGDSVNLASRLEGATKEYGVELLVTEAVAELARPFFHFRSVDSLRVKGKKKPVLVYTVEGEIDKLDPKRVAWLAQFEAAMESYRAARFTAARDLFAACREAYPDDRLAVLFEERSAAFAANPPPEPWDGVFTMTKK